MFSLRKKAYNDKLFGRVTNQRLQVSLLVVATIPDGNDFTERYYPKQVSHARYKLLEGFRKLAGYSSGVAYLIGRSKWVDRCTVY